MADQTPEPHIYLPDQGESHMARPIDPRIDATHFWENVTKTESCWLWTGWRSPVGYGRVYDKEARRSEWAHRYSFRLHGGEFLPKHEIDHICVTPECVNPAHLQQLTKAQHARVTMQRLGKDEIHLAAARLRRIGLTYKEIGEALSGGSAGSGFSAVSRAIEKGLIDPDEVPKVARLSDQERDEIRALYALGVNQPVIATIFGVDNSQVSRVCSGLTSGHSLRAGGPNAA